MATSVNQIMGGGKRTLPQQNGEPLSPSSTCASASLPASDNTPDMGKGGRGGFVEKREDEKEGQYNQEVTHEQDNTSSRVPSILSATISSNSNNNASTVSSFSSYDSSVLPSSCTTVSSSVCFSSSRISDSSSIPSSVSHITSSVISPSATMTSKEGTKEDEIFKKEVESKKEEVWEAVHEFPGGASISDVDLSLLQKAQHQDPFAVLGCHRIEGTDMVIVRGWVKDAREVLLTGVAGKSVIDNGPVYMDRRADWMFQKVFRLPSPESRLEYKFLVRYEGDHSNQQFEVYDTFSFSTLLADHDLKLFQSGSCWHVDDLMGSHVVTERGVRGIRFAVWAPSCRHVSVVGDFNQWDGRPHPMRKRHEYGVWELFIPGVCTGTKYGYRIQPGHGGPDFVKIDPYAQEFENPPATASTVSAFDDPFRPAEERFKWTDDAWMHRRSEWGRLDIMRRQPMSIYEVHLPSWMRGENNSYLGYHELADRLVVHVKNLNFTHVEFLPLAQHPFEGSWGYQITGQYAPYSRLGNGDDLKYLVNKLHENDIGVFLDFVPAHFCKDDWALAYYDGEPCYEYADPKEGEHKTWGTMVFNFGRNEVRSFLLGGAYHWLRRYHIDGLRIDAVSSMLYKNHCRPDGQWVPNEHGGDSNLQAISLLKELNWVVHQEFPGVFTMAEESTSWQGVTDRDKGLGFDAKWDLGWMNDTLSYMCTPTMSRHAKHSKLTFRGLYMAHEKWVLPLSHDEVVSGKGSLLDKCGFTGTPFEDRVKNLKALYGFQIGQPGRPLIFMGGEIGQGREWSDGGSVDWHEGEEDTRRKLCVWLSDLLAVYKHHPALHAGDDESWNFKWVDCDNAKANIVAFLRSYENFFNDMLVVTNFSGVHLRNYPIGVPHGGEWEVLLNSDDWRYGGAMVGPGNLSRIHASQGGRVGWPYCLWIDLPAFGCLYLKAPTPSEDELKRLEEDTVISKPLEVEYTD